MVGDLFVELAHQSLVGAEHDGTSHPDAVACRQLHGTAGLARAEADAQSKAHGAGVVRQGPHRRLILADARGRQRLHRADDGLQVPALSIFRRRVAVVVHSRTVRDGGAAGLTVAVGTTSRSGSDGRQGVTGDGDDHRPVLVTQRLRPCRIAPARPPECWSRPRARRAPRRSYGRVARDRTALAVSASRTAICAGTDTGADCDCLRQARTRRPCSMVLRVSSSSRVPKRANVSSSSNWA